MTNFFESWKIKRITSSSYHVGTNGQAESTNNVIINNMKKRLETTKYKWYEVLLECCGPIGPHQK